MKFTVTFKTPDAVEYAVADHIEQFEDEYIDVSPETIEECAESAAQEMKATTNKWVAYGEVITIEFDTEKSTAIVLSK